MFVNAGCDPVVAAFVNRRNLRSFSGAAEHVWLARMGVRSEAVGRAAARRS